ncbi:hypothetical protein ES703_30549 [subsurface metagenome]
MYYFKLFIFQFAFFNEVKQLLCVSVVNFFIFLLQAVS